MHLRQVAGNWETINLISVCLATFVSQRLLCGDSGTFVSLVGPVPPVQFPRTPRRLPPNVQIPYPPMFSNAFWVSVPGEIINQSLAGIGTTARIRNLVAINKRNYGLRAASEIEMFKRWDKCSTWFGRAFSGAAALKLMTFRVYLDVVYENSIQFALAIGNWLMAATKVVRWHPKSDPRTLRFPTSYTSEWNKRLWQRTWAIDNPSNHAICFTGLLYGHNRT